MSASSRLNALYEEWRLMSEAEGQAIRSEAWVQVARCQGVKSELQRQILEAVGGPDDSERSASSEELRARFGNTIRKLIELEHRNSSWLEECRQRKDTERAGEQVKQRSLGRLKDAYARQGGPAWQSYS